jgi:hypothetical protein
MAAAVKSLSWDCPSRTGTAIGRSAVGESPGPTAGANRREGCDLFAQFAAIGAPHNSVNPKIIHRLSTIFAVTLRRRRR